MSESLQLARQIAGVVSAEGEFLQPPSSDSVRAQLLKDAAGEAVFVQLREDTLALYRAARRIVCADDAEPPKTWRAPGWLSKHTERLEQLHRAGRCSFALKRSTKRQGRFGQDSRMEVKGRELELGQPKPFDLKKAVSLLTRFPALLEAVDEDAAMAAARRRTPRKGKKDDEGGESN